MRIEIIKDLENFSAGTVLSFASWRNEKDRSISGKLTHEGEFIHFDLGTFKRLNVFKATYKVYVSNLGLHHELSEALQCHFNVANDSLLEWNTEDEWFEGTSEVNQYLDDAGVPGDAEIIFYFSW